MSIKRWLLVFVLIVSLILAACGDDADEEAGGASSAQVEDTPEAPDEPTPELTVEPTDEPELAVAPLSVTEDAIIGTGTIRNLAWSPDSQQVAVSAGAGVLLYDATDLSVEPVLLRINGGAWSSAFSPDGSRLATSNVDVPVFAEDTQFVHLWDLATGERIAEFATGQDRVNRVTFSADGSLLVGAVRNSIYVWDASTLDVVEEVTIEGGKPSTVVVSPDNNLLAWGLADGIHLYARDTGEETLLPYSDDRNRSDYLAFSPDGAQIAAGASLKTPLVFDLASGEMVYQGGDDRVANGLRYNTAGNLVISGAYDVKTINPLTGEEVAVYKVKEGLLSPDESKILALDGMQLVMTDAATEDQLSAGDLWVIDQSPLVLPDFSAIIARQWLSKYLHLLDPADGSLMETVELSSGVSDDAIALSPDGTRLVAYTRAKTLLIVDTVTWEEIAAFEQETLIRAVALNSENSQLAISTRQGSTPLGVGVVDATTGEEIWFAELETEVVGLIFALDDAQVIGVAYKALYVFDAATGEILHDINREDQPGGEFFTYTPDGSALVLYGDTTFFPGEFINRYDPVTYELIDSVPGNHNYGVMGVAISADGTSMVTVGRDITLNQWDLTTRQLVAQADVLPDQMRGVAALNADATRVVTASNGGVLQIWTIGAE